MYIPPAVRHLAATLEINPSSHTFLPCDFRFHSFVFHTITIETIDVSQSPPQARRFTHRGECETRVTGDEAQGSMGQRKMRSFSFPPSFARNFFIEREREATGYEARTYPWSMEGSSLF